MFRLSDDDLAKLQREWTDCFVQANEAIPELKRFAGRIGRVVTVNWNGKALVDFADGAWYDIPADTEHLKRVDAEQAKNFDSKANSAQAHPERQA